MNKESPDSDNMSIGTVRLLYPSGEKKEMFNSTTKFNFTVSYSIQLFSMFYCAQIQLYLIGINLPGRNLPIFEKGGKFLPGNLKHGQVMERRLKKKS